MKKKDYSIHGTNHTRAAWIQSCKTDAKVWQDEDNEMIIIELFEVCWKGPMDSNEKLRQTSPMMSWIFPFDTTLAVGPT